MFAVARQEQWEYTFKYLVYGTTVARILAKKWSNLSLEGGQGPWKKLEIRQGD